MSFEPVSTLLWKWADVFWALLIVYRVEILKSPFGEISSACTFLLMKVFKVVPVLEKKKKKEAHLYKAYMKSWAPEENVTVPLPAFWYIWTTLLQRVLAEQERHCSNTAIAGIAAVKHEKTSAEYSTNSQLTNKNNQCSIHI